MLALVAPYGWPRGRGLSLKRTAETIDREAVTQVLLQFSCWPPVIPKILDCLEHSGVYETRLQSGAAEEITANPQAFAALGLTATVESKADAQAVEAAHYAACDRTGSYHVPFTHPRSVPLVLHGDKGTT